MRAVAPAAGVRISRAVPLAVPVAATSGPRRAARRRARASPPSARRPALLPVPRGSIRIASARARDGRCARGAGSPRDGCPRATDPARGSVARSGAPVPGRPSRSDGGVACRGSRGRACAGARARGAPTRRRSPRADRPCSTRRHPPRETSRARDRGRGCGQVASDALLECRDVEPVVALAVESDRVGLSDEVGSARNAAGFEHLPQAPQRRAEAASRARLGLFTPEQPGQRLARVRLSTMEEQPGQERLHRVDESCILRPAIVRDLNGTEELNAKSGHRRAPISADLCSGGPAASRQRPAILPSTCQSDCSRGPRSQ